MRSAFLFPLSLSLVVAAGCASPVKDQTAARSDLERDLTLVSSNRETAIATPIELGRIRQPAGSQNIVSSRHTVVRRRAAARSAVSSPKPVKVVASAPAPAPKPAVAQPEPMPADPHELPPGRTVTIIPVSTGPSTAGRDPDGFPRPGYGTGGSGMGGGGSGMGGGERAGGGSGMGGDCPRPDFGPRTIAGRTRGLLY
jgi:hypothetical protein